jgi:hypothetical protein
MNEAKGMMSRNNALSVAVELRRQECMKLRLTGLSYPDIRDAMIQRHGLENLPGGYDERTVYADVQHELKKLNDAGMETAKELRQMESNRLDMAQAAIMPAVLRGDFKAVDRLIRIMDHRAKLFGLYAPSQMKIHDWRSEILELIQTGRITIAQVEEEIGTELTRQLLESGSNGSVEGRFTEEKASGE